MTIFRPFLRPFLRTFLWAAGAVAALVSIPSAASAQTLASNPSVEIRNNGDETRKICFHKAKQVTLFAIGCVVLRRGESINWNREGVFTPFKVKVYKKRKVLDKYLYARDLPADTGKIIIGTGGRFGFSRFKNIRKNFAMHVCNTQYDDPVYLVLGFDTTYGKFSQGWYSLSRGECKTLTVTRRLKDNWNLPNTVVPRIYYYARTYGDKPLYWRGRDKGRTFCMNPGKRFRAKLQGDGECGTDQVKKSFRYFYAPSQSSPEQLSLDF